MKLLLAAAATLTAMTTMAQAATVDLTDGVFANPTTDVITETSDGVTFTFTATDNQTGGARWLNVTAGDFANGLQLGGGGGSTIEFTLVVSDDIELNGYGTNQGGGFALAAPTFDLFDGATSLLADQPINNAASTNIFNASGENIVLASGLSIALTAGTAYTFDINDNGAAVQGFLTSLEFSTPVSNVPVPAALPLALTTIGAFAFVSRRRRDART